MWWKESQASKEGHSSCGIFFLKGPHFAQLENKGNFIPLSYKCRKLCILAPRVLLVGLPLLLCYFLQGILPKMLLFWFTIVAHHCEIQTVDKMGFIFLVRKLGSIMLLDIYLLLDKICSRFPLRKDNFSKSPFLLVFPIDYLVLVISDNRLSQKPISLYYLRLFWF